MLGWRYAQNTKILFRAERIPRKHHFWSFLAITIAVCQIQMIILLIPHQNEHRYAQNTKILFRAEMIPRKHHYLSFLAVTIAVCQIQMISTLILLRNEHDGMGICAKHINFIQCGNDSQKTPFLVVFGNNNCSVSNQNDFITPTSSKSTCWDGDMRKTYKFNSELKILLKNIHYLSFLAITIAVCQIQMTLTLIPLQNEHDEKRICDKHKFFFQSGNDSQKTPFLVVYGYNNCSVSNQNDFITHTSSN